MKRILYRHILLLFAVAACVSCSRHSGGKLSLRQAHYVVAQADSLWHEGQMYGIDSGDSATLAQAYETLGHFPLSIGNHRGEVYSHACYHYGRLLRAKENPVEAMQAFIAATHPRTRDYHILGRVYSNMGDICHLAEEFQLSYDMFEKSSEMFLKNGDTINYYYALNEMAFELAVQGEKEDSYAILSSIEEKAVDTYTLGLIYETKAIACKKVQQYDSTLHYVHLAYSSGSIKTSLFLVSAQAYYYLGNKDSAVYYANKILEQSHLLQEINNALFILTNDDASKDINAVRQVAADRSDTQKILEIRQGKLSQAVQLLEQDMVRKPDLRWLYAIIATIVIIGTGLLLYIRRKYRQHQLLSQQVDDLKNETEYMQEKHEQILQEHKYYTDTLRIQIEENCMILCQSKDFPNNICWKDFSAMSKIINDNFGMLVQKLQNLYHMQEKEIRLCILVLFGKHNGKQLAKLLFYAESGVRNFKSRVANKLGTNSTELHNFLINLAISEYSKCTP